MKRRVSKEGESCGSFVCFSCFGSRSIVATVDKKEWTSGLPRATKSGKRGQYNITERDGLWKLHAAREGCSQLRVAAKAALSNPTLDVTGCVVAALNGVAYWFEPVKKPGE